MQEAGKDFPFLSKREVQVSTLDPRAFQVVNPVVLLDTAALEICR